MSAKTNFEISLEPERYELKVDPRSILRFCGAIAPAGPRSGGEQQMLAIARGLMGAPAPFASSSLGLSPALTY